MSVFIDDSEVYALARDFGQASNGLLKEVDQVVKKGADNIKKDLTAQFAGSRWFRGAAGSVSYDQHYRVGGVGYEVGPDKTRRGGPLGNIFFFGGAHGGGGTGDLDGPLQAEGPRLEKALGILAEEKIL